MKRESHLSAPALAALLTALQVGLAYLMATGATPFAWSRLCAWDCGWFANIVSTGYHSTFPLEPQNTNSNVGFFPAFPLAALIVRSLTSARPETALVITAQLFALGFWWQLILLLRSERGDRANAPLVLLMLLCFPSAFFLVAGYSESTLMFGLAGFIYWSRKTTRAAFPVALACGVVMSSSRLVGLPLVIFPLIEAAANHHPRPRFLRALLLTAGAAAGGLCFFLFCQQRFGNWHLYFDTQLVGWRHQPDLLTPFRWRVYSAFFEPGLYAEIFGHAFTDGLAQVSAEMIGRVLIVPLTLVILFAMLRSRSDWKGSLALIYTALVLHLVPLVSIAPALDSHVRHALPLCVPLALLLYSRATAVSRLALIGCVMAAAVSLLAQTILLYRFLHGQWVA